MGAVQKRALSARLATLRERYATHVATGLTLTSDAVAAAVELFGELAGEVARLEDRLEDRESELRALVIGVRHQQLVEREEERAGGKPARALHRIAAEALHARGLGKMVAPASAMAAPKVRVSSGRRH